MMQVSAQPLTTAGEELDHLDHDLTEVLPRVCLVGILRGYPGTYPSITKTTRLDTRVPRREPGTYPSMAKITMLSTRVSRSVPGYLPEYNQNNQFRYPGTPWYTPGVPGYLPEYDQNNQIWYSGTPECIPYQY